MSWPALCLCHVCAASWSTLSLWPVNAVSWVVIILWTPEPPPANSLWMMSPVRSSSCGRCLLTHPKPVTCECCLVCGHLLVARVRPDLPSACSPVYAVSWTTLSLWPVNAVSCVVIILWTLPPDPPPARDLWMMSPVRSSSCGCCLLTHPQPVTCECCLLCGHHPVDAASWPTPSPWPVNDVSCVVIILWMLPPDPPPACDLWMPSPVWSSSGG